MTTDLPNPHAAPGVRFGVGRSQWLLCAGLLVWLSSLVCVIVWSQRFGPVSWHHTWDHSWQYVVVAVACVLCGATFAQSWQAMLLGDLQWRDPEWMWQPLQETAVLVVPTVKLDLQGLMLLSLRDENGRRLGWACAERASDPAHWSDFRRAVYSRRKPPSNPL